MSDLIKFRNDVRTLQVMSPGNDESKFRYILNSHADYDDWLDGLDTIIFTTFAPLADYFYSETNVITDNERRPVEDISLLRMIRKQYNQVLLGMLLTSTSEVIRTDIDEMYRTLKNTTEDAAKAIFYKLRITYSTMCKDLTSFLNLMRSLIM